MGWLRIKCMIRIASAVPMHNHLQANHLEFLWNIRTLLSPQEHPAAQINAVRGVPTPLPAPRRRPSAGNLRSVQRNTSASRAAAPFSMVTATGRPMGRLSHQGRPIGHARSSLGSRSIFNSLLRISHRGFRLI